VVSVCAIVEATANPKMALMAAIESDFFISNTWLRPNLVGADTKESPRAVSADVKTSSGMLKMISL
jgi:hypothetical protein